MKLRIRGNSVRLRVTRTEREAIGAGETVSETTDFGGGHLLTCRLTVDPDADVIGASFDDGIITVRLPAPLAAEWAGSELVSLAGEQPAADGEALAILVEKDFQCLAPREGEDESDMFLHPGAVTGGC